MELYFRQTPSHCMTHTTHPHTHHTLPSHTHLTHHTHPSSHTAHIHPHTTHLTHHTHPHIPHTSSHTTHPHTQGIDVKSMGRIFIGLVKCGAWGCFDEFNRLEEAVLSAVSMQIQTIQAALRTRAPSCELLERQVGEGGTKG